MNTSIVFINDAQIAVPILIDPIIKECLKTPASEQDDRLAYDVPLFVMPKIDTDATRTAHAAIRDFNARMKRLKSICAEWQPGLKHRLDNMNGDPSKYLEQYSIINESNVVGHWITPIEFRDVPNCEEEQAYAYCRFVPNDGFWSINLSSWTTSLRAACSLEKHVEQTVHVMSGLVTIDIAPLS